MYQPEWWYQNNITFAIEQFPLIIFTFFLVPILVFLNLGLIEKETKCYHLMKFYGMTDVLHYV